MVEENEVKFCWYTRAAWTGYCPGLNVTRRGFDIASSSLARTLASIYEDSRAQPISAAGEVSRIPQMDGMRAAELGVGPEASLTCS